MSALDNLAPDQRAVLQMVLQRGRTYDEIANVLSIDRAAVRQRALDGFDALTPTTVIPGPERALVTDYLLGQLPDRVAEQVHAYLRASDSDREWAQAIAAQLAPLTSHSLPEIPVGAPLGADDAAGGGPERDSDPLPAVDAPAPLESDRDLDAAADAVRTAALTGISLTPAAAVTREGAAGDPQPPRRSSRRGGAILLGAVVVVIVAAIIVGVVSSGGSSPHHAPGADTATAPDTTTTADTTTSTPQMLAQLNLTSPSGDASMIGVAQVIREGSLVGVVIDAQGLPANTTHNAYAVWLYDSPTRFKFVGFVPNLVGKDGKLATEGKLPVQATSYHRLLLTLETQSKPVSPGQVVLSGPFREHT